MSYDLFVKNALNTCFEINSGINFKYLKEKYMDNAEINGYQNEIMFAKNLNGKKIKYLYPNLQDLVIELFGFVDFNSIIYSWVDFSKKKYDIIIKLDGNIKRISIKKGINNSVHTEGISSFIHFLIENKVPKDIVYKYLRYHYSDGTTNGKGKVRMSSMEYKETHLQDIEDINKYFSNRKLLKKCINRFILQGNNSDETIDGIIYGVVEDFLFISSDDVLKILLKHSNDYHNGVHFSDLFCQAKAKNLNNNPKHEKDRYCVQVKWFNLFDCILENNYDKNLEMQNIK